jgi:1A family penicillin-binding protein
MRARLLVVLTCGLFLFGFAVHAAMFAGTLVVHGLVKEVASAADAVRMETGPQTTIVYDRHDRPLYTFFTEQRIDVPLDYVPPQVIAAVLAAEDRRFHEHRGFDLPRIAGAARVNWQAGRIVQGGSTITQQVARAAALGRERTLQRKVREVFLAAELERRYTKHEILETYLNHVYFGDGYYGVEAASRGYFGRMVKDLSVADAAVLAGLIRSPSTLAPTIAPDAARRRRNVVLAAMLEEGWISEEDRARAAESPVSVQPRRPHSLVQFGENAIEPNGAGRYFIEDLRRELVRHFGANEVYMGGLRVYSTLDLEVQRAAEEALARRLEEVSSNRSFRQRLRADESVTAGDLQAALVAIEPETGYVRALVGGRDFNASEFNRATQARRQPGSAFKPLIFAAALEQGYGPGSLLRELDRPVDTPEGPWLPEGFNEASEYTLRRALQVSSNRAAVQLLQRIGIGAGVEFAQRFGIRSPLPAVPSLALGTGELTLLELTSAFGVFASRGVHAAPLLMRRVERSDGTLLWDDPGIRRRVISASSAYLMSSMLSDVITRGTASRVRSLGFRRPAAGKTGTTDNYADAWFVGYTPHLVTGVWFGFDQPVTIMPEGFGGILAVPAWTYFMIEATNDHPEERFEQPAGVERVTLCSTSGLRATSACQTAAEWARVASQLGEDAVRGVTDVRFAGAGVYGDLFPAGAVPPAACPVHVQGRSAARHPTGPGIVLTGN